VNPREGGGVYQWPEASGKTERQGSLASLADGGTPNFVTKSRYPIDGDRIHFGVFFPRILGLIPSLPGGQNWTEWGSEWVSRW
jgi:hypothetical protein